MRESVSAKLVDEAVHLAAPDLEVDGAAEVIGIVLDHRAVEMVDWIGAPVMLVRELRPQTIDIAATTFKREIPQHVVEGAILQHQDNDVVDLPQVGHAGLLSHHRLLRGRVGRRSSTARLATGAAVEAGMACT